MTITPAQIKGARGMLRGSDGVLGMSQVELAKLATMSHTALASIESGAAIGRPATLAKIQKALEDAGAKFLPETSTDGVGVRIDKRRRK